MGFLPMAVVVVITTVVAGGLIFLLRRLNGMTSDVSIRSGTASQNRGPAASKYRSEARATGAALLIGCSVAMLMSLISSWWGQGYGLPFALAGGAGTVVGLLAYSLWPRPAWTAEVGTPVVAELEPRGVTTFARERVFVLPLTAAIMLVLGLLLAGIYSATDEHGLHRVFQRRSLSGWAVENGQVSDVQYNISSSGPFPGWYYGVPMIIGTALMICVVYWSLRRIAAAPRPPSADLFDLDRSLRSLATTFVMAASSSALAFQIAGLGIITGIVLRSSHTDPVPTIDSSLPPGTIAVEPGHSLALTLILVSILVGITAVVLLVKAVTISTNLQSLARTISNPNHEPAR